VIAFSVLCNGIRGKQPAARALADQIASEIALHLWAADAHPSTIAPAP
jgi:hypothetical protein